MNILYYSVHQILEYDEVRLFQRLGHNVFCLGVNSPHGAVQDFRPAIEFRPDEIELFDLFERSGGIFQYGNVNSIVLPEGFIDHFDVVVVMHDRIFIEKYWNQIKNCCVVWRTIGQAIISFENALMPFREEGLAIVRYSDVEKNLPNGLGEDAIIRFSKSPDEYGNWVGNEQKILTFANVYAQRYPEDAKDYQAITAELPSVLGGVGNESIEGSISFVSAAQQMELYKSSRVYLYASGLDIPYTLNFIEAWMTGIPLVVYAPLRKGQFFEIDRLVVDGVTGFICRDISSARRRLTELLADKELAAKIGAAGRTAAINYFGDGKIENEWLELFKKIVPKSKKK